MIFSEQGSHSLALTGDCSSTKDLPMEDPEVVLREIALERAHKSGGHEFALHWPRIDSEPVAGDCWECVVILPTGETRAHAWSLELPDMETPLEELMTLRGIEKVFVSWAAKLNSQIRLTQYGSEYVAVEISTEEPLDIDALFGAMNTDLLLARPGAYVHLDLQAAQENIAALRFLDAVAPPPPEPDPEYQTLVDAQFRRLGEIGPDATPEDCEALAADVRAELQKLRKKYYQKPEES